MRAFSFIATKWSFLFFHRVFEECLVVGWVIRSCTSCVLYRLLLFYAIRSPTDIFLAVDLCDGIVLSLNDLKSCRLRTETPWVDKMTFFSLCRPAGFFGTYLLEILFEKKVCYQYWWGFYSSNSGILAQGLCEDIVGRCVILLLHCKMPQTKFMNARKWTSPHILEHSLVENYTYIVSCTRQHEFGISELWRLRH